jgi:hypothetical protein
MALAKALRLGLLHIAVLSLHQNYLALISQDLSCFQVEQPESQSALFILRQECY